ncbi:MAG: heavy-metal-associated domain-containing protein [Bacteroidales bacterium]|nr:heavy-metal-associated domain-containing protein [Bacteroidales bacterium]
MEKRNYKITGLHCQHCVNNVKNTLLQSGGITKVDISADNKLVTIEAEEIPDLGKLNSLIRNTGNYKLSEN